MMRTI